MARHGGVTFKSKKYGSNALHKSDVLPDQFSGRRRPAEAPHEGRFLLQVDRQTKEAFQTREAAQKAETALKRAFPILQVGVVDVEDRRRELIVPPSA